MSIAVQGPPTLPNRSSRFVRALVTGYAALGVNIIYSLVSVPLFLAYLSPEEFGLWAVAMQINGYLGLIDLGMSGAIGRFLADHKDDVQGRPYAETFVTGAMVYAIQGALVAALGTVLASVTPQLLGLPEEQPEEMAFLLQVLCIASGISIACRSFGSPLWAFQRMDVVSIDSAVTLIVGLGAAWAGLHLGLGVRAFAYSTALPLLISPVLFYTVCSRNRFYPPRLLEIRPRWSIFRTMFSFAKDVMLLSVGNQLVAATQLTIVSRILGLEAAAAYSVGTKLAGLCLRIVQKVMESSAPALAELHIRGQVGAFQRRYLDACYIVLAAATVGGVALASGNSAFITLWTGGKVEWLPASDILLGLLLLAQTLTGSFISIFGITKNLRPIRSLVLLEGLIFVPAAVLAARAAGIEGLLVASILIHILVTVRGSFRAASQALRARQTILKAGLFGAGLVGAAFGSMILIRLAGSSITMQLGASFLLVLASAVLIACTILPPSVLQATRSRFRTSKA